MSNLERVVNYDILLNAKHYVVNLSNSDRVYISSRLRLGSLPAASFTSPLSILALQGINVWLTGMTDLDIAKMIYSSRAPRWTTMQSRVFNSRPSIAYFSRMQSRVFLGLVMQAWATAD